METKQQLEKIESLTEGFSISKYNSLKINYLVRLIKDVALFSEQCSTCKSNQVVLENMIDEIPFLDDIEHRKPYEKSFNQIRKHFHQEHGYIPLYHFIARYTVIGAVVGAALASLVFYAFTRHFWIDALLAGSTIGILVAYFLGAQKELKFRKLKKII